MSTLHFKSTRSSDESLTFAQAVVKGIASGGGLFVPTEIPKLDFLKWSAQGPVLSSPCKDYFKSVCN